MSEADHYVFWYAGKPSFSAEVPLRLTAGPIPMFEFKRKLEYDRIPGQEAFDSGKNTSVIR